MMERKRKKGGDSKRDEGVGNERNSEKRGRDREKLEIGRDMGEEVETVDSK